MADSLGHKAIDIRVEDSCPDKGARSAKEMDLLQKSTKKSKTNVLKSDLKYVDVVMGTPTEIQKSLVNLVVGSDLVATDVAPTGGSPAKNSFRDSLIGIQSFRDS